MSLTDKVAALTGPDREMDAEILAAFGLEGAWCVDYSQPELPGKPLPVTGSIDAAVALVEKVLPGRGWLVDNDEGFYSASIYSPGDREQIFDADNLTSNAAIALILAALQAMGDRRG